MREKIFYIVCFGFLLGTLARSFLFVPALAPDIPEGTFEGMVEEEPDAGENNQKLVVKTEGMKVLVTTGLEQYFRYGDEVRLSGKPKLPENFVTDQGKVFDYVNYLRKDGIRYVVSYPKIEILSRGRGSFLRNALFFAKEKFMDALKVSIPSPESKLLGGLILGDRSSFSSDMRQQFVDTGTIHIVALSGYNVTIVAEWIMKIFSFLPRLAGFGAGILGIILFVIMSGGTSTAVRAGIMAVLGILARVLGRPYEAGRGLILAAAAMCLANPLIIAYDASFQLSFLATAAVIFVPPRIEKHFYWIKWKWLREITVTTSSAYVCVAPYIFWQMGNLSLVAIPANLLVLPAIPLTMLLGFAAGFTGLLSPILSAPFGYFSYALLHYELWIIGAISKIPFASISVGDFPPVSIVLIYAFLILWLLRSSFQSPPS